MRKITRVTWLTDDGRVIDEEVHEDFVPEPETGNDLPSPTRSASRYPEEFLRFLLKQCSFAPESIDYYLDEYPAERLVEVCCYVLVGDAKGQTITNKRRWVIDRLKKNKHGRDVRAEAFDILARNQHGRVWLAWREARAAGADFDAGLAAMLKARAQ